LTAHVLWFHTGRAVNGEIATACDFQRTALMLRALTGRATHRFVSTGFLVICTDWHQRQTSGNFHHITADWMRSRRTNDRTHNTRETARAAIEHRELVLVTCSDLIVVTMVFATRRRWLGACDVQDASWAARASNEVNKRHFSRIAHTNGFQVALGNQ